MDEVMATLKATIKHLKEGLAVFTPTLPCREGLKKFIKSPHPGDLEGGTHHSGIIGSFYLWFAWFWYK